MNRTKIAFLLGAILFLGLILRVGGLADESLWLDEGFSVRVASLDPAALIHECISDNHPPLHYLFLHYWMKIFGTSEYPVRLLSVLFGFLLIPVIYKTGRLLFSENAALLAALLTAISGFQLKISQSARMYSLAVLLAALSIYLFIRLLEKGDRKSALSYLLVTIALLYTHYSGLYVVLAENLFFFSAALLSKENRDFHIKKWVALQGLIVMLFLPWFLVASGQLGAVLRSAADEVTLPMAQLFVKPVIDFSMSRIGAIMLAVPLLMVFFPPAKRSDEPGPFSYSQKIYALFLWLAVPIISVAIAIKLKVLFYSPRYCAVASGAFYLLVSQGAANIRVKFLKKAVLGIVIIFFLFHAWLYCTTYKNEQWRDASAYITANAKAGDLLVFHSGWFSDNVFDYYCKREDLTRMPFPGWSAKIPVTTIAKSKQVSEEDIKKAWPEILKYGRVWVIICWDRDGQGLLKEAFERAYRRLDSKQFYGITVTLFERAGPQQ